MLPGVMNVLHYISHTFCGLHEALFVSAESCLFVFMGKGMWKPGVLRLVNSKIMQVNEMESMLSVAFYSRQMLPSEV